MIYVYFKASDTDESIWDLNEDLKVELQHAMGRNHHRDEEATRRGNSGELILPPASKLKTAKASWCVSDYFTPIDVAVVEFVDEDVRGRVRACSQSGHTTRRALKS